MRAIKELPTWTSSASSFWFLFLLPLIPQAQTNLEARPEVRALVDTGWESCRADWAGRRGVDESRECHCGADVQSQV